MSRLRELQEQFQTYVYQQKDDIERKIVNAPQLSVHERVEIYRKGYYMRLSEILEREFSALKNLLGAEKFDALCRDYIDAYPSTHFSVRAYGRYMVKYLSSLPEIDPLHVELAEFEWSFGKVIDGPDGPQVTLEDMANIAPEAWAELRLALHPSLRFVALQLNSPAIWQALFENDPTKPIPAVQSAEQPVNWMLWRFNQQAHYQPASPAHMIMVQAIEANQTFSDICEALCDSMAVEGVPQFAGTTLRDWISLGLISRLITDQTTSDQP